MNYLKYAEKNAHDLIKLCDELIKEERSKNLKKFSQKSH